ncbi:MAG: amidohydrolase family protein, partial [Desulfobacterales bacterium]|nr:amidohydrolase family protein [Desulfobacterales bacterium]
MDEHKKDADLVIEGGMVITMAEGQTPISNGRVLIKDGIITDIQSRKEKDEGPGIRAEVIDAKDAIVMPGLVNAHTHTAMTLFRGLADDLPLKQWLFEKIFPAEAKFLNPDTVYWGSLLGCLEMIASGTTCIADGYFFQDETVRAVHESGLR